LGACSQKDNPYRPFCSERCKLIDLGMWVGEQYRIPGQGLVMDPSEMKSGTGGGGDDSRDSDQHSAHPRFFSDHETPADSIRIPPPFNHAKEIPPGESGFIFFLGGVGLWPVRRPPQV